MKLNKVLEQKLRIEVLGYLQNGKPGWDVPHTYNAVRWMRKLIEKEGGSEKVLVSTMYLHDIGYPQLQKGYNFKQLIKSKEMHAERGAELSRKILKKIGGYSKKEIDRVAYLVENHDKHDNVTEFDRKMVMDADSLSILDWEVVPPTFDKKESLKYITYYEKERGQDRWNTKTCRKYLKELLKKAKAYWN